MNSSHESASEYTYFAYENCIKSIHKIHLDENKLIDELHGKLRKGLLTAAGKDIKPLGDELKGISRIKLGKKNEFRLAFTLSEKNNHYKVTLLQFGKTEDPDKKNEFYRRLLKWRNSGAPQTQRLVQLQKNNYQTVEAFRDFISSGYRFVVSFSQEQKSLLQKIKNSTNRFVVVNGMPGSGKSILAAESALKLSKEQDETVLIITPNERLIRVYESYLINNGVAKEKINRYSRNSLLKSHINIATLKDLMIKIIPEFDQANSHHAVDVLRKNDKICRLCGFADDPKTLLDFYNAFFDENDEIIEYPDKDALLPLYEDCILRISENITEITKYLQTNKAVSRRQIAYDFMREIVNPVQSDILNFVMAGNYLTVIIDEVQDLLFAEWNAFLKLFAATNRSSISHLRCIVLGDEKQRVTLSGFTWSGFKSTVHEVISREFPNAKISDGSAYLANETLLKNYRVPKNVALFIEALDGITEKNGSRHVLTIKPEDCESNGQKVKCIQTSEKELVRAVIRYNQDQKVDSVGNDAKLLVVSENPKVRETLSARTDLEVLSLYEVKGTEYDHLVLLNPFKDTLGDGIKTNSNLKSDENYKLYTLLTRTRNALTVIVSRDELAWLQRIFAGVIDRGDIEIVPAVDEVIALYDILRDNGLESLSVENILQIALNRLDRLLQEANYSQPQFYLEVNTMLLKVKEHPFLLEPLLAALKAGISISRLNYPLLNNSLKGNHSDCELLIACWAFINNEPMVMKHYIQSIPDEELIQETEDALLQEYGAEISSLNDAYDSYPNDTSLPLDNPLIHDILLSLRMNSDTVSENTLILKEVNQHINKLQNKMKRRMKVI